MGRVGEVRGGYLSLDFVAVSVCHAHHLYSPALPLHLYLLHSLSPPCQPFLTVSACLLCISTSPALPLHLVDPPPSPLLIELRSHTISHLPSPFPLTLPSTLPSPLALNHPLAPLPSHLRLELACQPLVTCTRRVLNKGVHTADPSNHITKRAAHPNSASYPDPPSHTDHNTSSDHNRHCNSNVSSNPEIAIYQTLPSALP